MTQTTDHECWVACGCADDSEEEEYWTRQDLRLTKIIWDFMAELNQTDPHMFVMGDGNGGMVIDRIIEAMVDLGMIRRPPAGSWKPRTEVEYLADRDHGFRCSYCQCRLVGHPDFPHPHVDHVIPKSRGGSDHVDNKVLACPSCNSRKGARTPAEWLDT